MNFTICICSCLFTGMPSRALADTENAIEQRAYRYDQIHGFMNHLFRMGEYSLARNELYRMKSLYPELVSESVFKVTETHLLFSEGMYEKTACVNSSFPVLDIYRFDSLVFLRRMEESDIFIHSDFGNIDRSLSEMLKRRQLMSELLNDRELSVDLSETGIGADDVRRIIEETRTERLKIKKPWLGAGLSVIPGCGYVYADQALTGVVAFLVVSGLSVLTYYAFRTDNRPAGIFLGAAAVFFYGGNILGGYRDTLRYNSGIDEKCRAFLDAKLNLERDRQNLVRSYGLVTDDKSR